MHIHASVNAAVIEPVHTKGRDGVLVLYVIAFDNQPVFACGYGSYRIKCGIAAVMAGQVPAVQINVCKSQCAFKLEKNIAFLS